MAKIRIKDKEVTVVQVDSTDYICLTDMIKAKDGESFVTDLLRNRNTLEYIGIWEQVNNPNFNYGEFATNRNKAENNTLSYSLSDGRKAQSQDYRVYNCSRINTSLYLIA